MPEDARVAGVATMNLNAGNHVGLDARANMRLDPLLFGKKRLYLMSYQRMNRE